MKILCLQTICKVTQVFLVSQEANIIRSREYDYCQNQSDDLIASIQEISKNQTITHILVVNGQGSYTGTRIGVATANALAFAWQIPVGCITVNRYIGDETHFDFISHIQDFFADPSWDTQVVPVYNREPKIG